MLAFAQPLQLDVDCPACTPLHVPLEVIEASQRLLDELGPCVGLASFECPALYFAALVPREVLAQLHAAAGDDDEIARELARWEDEGGACGR